MRTFLRLGVFASLRFIYTDKFTVLDTLLV